MLLARMRNAIPVLAALIAAIPAQAPSNYYNAANTSSASTLRSSLHAIIDDHTRVPYTSSATDTWNVLEAADQHPSNSSQILDLYRNGAYSKYGGGNSNYDREHSWPKSYGFPNDGTGNYPYTDCHHLFLCNSSYNSSRNNNPFDAGTSSWTEKTTYVNAGQGGGSGTFPGNSNWRSTDFWQTWNGRKGDVARALLYLDVRYEGGVHGVTGKAEPDLRLTDDVNLIAASNTGSNLGVAYMGKKSTLLQWHAADPVDSKEMARNNAVYAQQGNRNPFIDHPEWVAIVFGGGSGSGSGGGTPWINELHYDNAGSDVGEFVEIAGPAGTNLGGWQLVGYNGSGGGSYKTVNLAGTIPSQQNGYGAVSFVFSGMQNGAPDGIALISNTGTVVQFLSYEGTFSATSGPAAGVTSTNIGVSETTSTSVGYSLQLGGTGHAYADFTWQTPRNDTPGAVNSGQTLQ
ncbi:MAG: endonuclease [Planctomycetes bacterium]|nr:endonuclease [Planctomycetota bacterium]